MSALSVARQLTKSGLSNNVVKALRAELKNLRTRKAFVPNADIANLVSALEEHDDTCSRLENTTFGIILDTLLQASYSRKKERGILLLTVRSPLSIHYGTS